MRLVIATPLEIVADVADVRRVRAEDRTGSFALLRGHAELVSALEVSVLSFLESSGRERYVALRGGLLTVSRDGLVTVATREAVLEDDLDRLSRGVLDAMRQRAAAAHAASVATLALERGLLRRAAERLRREPKRAWMVGPSAREPWEGGESARERISVGPGASFRRGDR